MSSESIKRGISLGALSLVILHVLWPDLGIDAVTIALLFVAALPWVGPVLKGLAESGLRKVELPGGIKIDLADVKSATDKIIRGSGGLATPMPVVEGSATVTAPISPTVKPPEPEPPSVDPLGYIGEISDADANLALVAFRIEIEKRLRALAEASGLITHMTGLSNLVRQMQQHQVLSPIMASGLMQLIGFGNRAAHGVEVAQAAAGWVHDVAPSIIMELDAISNRIKSIRLGTQNNSVNTE